MAIKMRSRAMFVASGFLLALCAGTASAQWSQSGPVVFYNGGNVGIGTGTPFGALHVVGTTNGVGNLRSDNAGTGPAIFGYASATSGFNYGLLGAANSPNGRGVWGIGNTSTGDAIGVRGTSYSATGYGGVFDGGQYGLFAQSASPGGATVGVWGQVSSPDGWGGVFKGGRYGVWGEANGAGRFAGYFLGNGYFSGSVGIGTTTPTSPLTVLATSGSAIYGRVSDGTSVQAETEGATSTAVRGAATSTGNGSTVGVQGTASSTNGVGVYGLCDATTGATTGVLGSVISPSGNGMTAENNANTGTGSGLFASTQSTAGYAILAQAQATTGNPRAIDATALAPSAVAISGSSLATTGTGTGVYGQTSSPDGVGVWGQAPANSTVTGYAVYGANASSTGFAVFAAGNTGASGTKSFVIDHPLDPANKLLKHYSAESPEPYLMYRGNVQLDGQGEAWVTLPEYFEAINRDFHYQLTSIGAPALIYVAEEIQNNQFKIAGGNAGMKVSWTVTGIRNDAWVRANGAEVEIEKTGAMQGKFLQPELFNGSENNRFRPAVESAAPVTRGGAN